MKFIAISDTHCRHHSLNLPPGDVLIHAGDFCNRGLKEEVVDFLSWFSRQPFRYRVLIGGNHDFFMEKTAQVSLRKLIPENIIYLNDSGVSIEGVSIWGSPVTPWFYNWAFNRHRGNEIRKHWDMIPPDTDLLITHGPPFGILDKIFNERNAGCRDLLERVRIIQPRVHVFGHIHESFGACRKGTTLFLNCCIVNEFYERVNHPQIFEL